MDDAALRPALRWLPLVGWARPACPPLPARIAEITQITRDAREPDTDTAAGAAHALNKAALLASDCGIPALARDLCLRHIAAYAAAGRPLTVPLARQMLGPAVNLARLALRTREPGKALYLLDAINTAVAAGTDFVIDGCELPLAGVAGSRDEHRRLRQSVWLHYLATSIQAHAQAGRWDHAAQFARDHRGIGDHLMEGRQAAIISHCLNGDHHAARRLLSTSAISQPWEQQIADCLTVMCATPQETPAAARAMTRQYLHDQPADGRIVFHARLGLTVAALTEASGEGTAPEVLACLTEAVLRTPDGYAARDILQTPAAVRLDPRHRERLTRLAGNSGLGTGALPAQLHRSLEESTHTALALLTASLASHGQASG
jgi:hypothetical protein